MTLQQQGYHVVEMPYLGIDKTRKYVMDENCHLYWEEPPNIINGGSFYVKRGWKEQGHDDKFLLALATREGYTIVTRDRGFVKRAVEQRIEIIYKEKEGKLFLYKRGSIVDI